jgi:hypothetical protein
MGPGNTHPALRAGAEPHVGDAHVPGLVALVAALD